MTDGTERRRAARMDTRVWVQIAGVDSVAELRRGDISITGLRVELDKNVGALSTVQALELASADRRQHCTLLARVVRVSAVDDLWRGQRITEAAFEFLTESSEKRGDLETLIRYLFSQRIEAHPSTALYKLAAQAQKNAGVGASAVLHELRGHQIYMDTNFAAGVGEAVECELRLPASGKIMSLSGRVVDVEPTFQAGFRLGLELSPETVVLATPADGSSIDDAVDVLLDELVALPPSGESVREGEHLSGSLTRIRLPSLFLFLEMEGMSGALTVSSGLSQVVVFFGDGRIVDTEVIGEGVPVRPMIAELLRWNDGEFDLRVEKVTRTDRVGVSTRELLHELGYA